MATNREVWENRLVTVTKENGKWVRKGKRVSKNCPITYEERRIYVKKGLIACTLAIRDRLDCTSTQALKVALDAAFGEW